jgi:cytochrome c553
MRTLFKKTSMSAAYVSLAVVLAFAGSNSAWAQTPPAGRLLASNCFQCHGTNGAGPGFERLTGDSSNSIYNSLKSYQSRSNDIMGVHAKGYTDAQLRAIADWLSTQR